jgi:hypothetical protein
MGQQIINQQGGALCHSPRTAAGSGRPRQNPRRDDVQDAQMPRAHGCAGAANWMRLGAHGDNLHNVLAKTHIPNDRTWGTLQILTAHTWANIYLVAPCGSETAGNIFQ